MNITGLSSLKKFIREKEFLRWQKKILIGVI